MKRTIIALAACIPLAALATGGHTPPAPQPTVSIGISANPSAHADANAGAQAAAQATGGNATAAGGSANVSGVSATSSPTVSPVISPVITGGNSAATIGNVSGGSVGNVTGGGATVKDVGNLSVGAGALSPKQSTDVDVVNSVRSSNENVNLNLIKGGDTNVKATGGAGGSVHIAPGAVSATGGKGGEGGKAVIEAGAIQNHVTGGTAKIEKGAVAVDAKAAATAEQTQKQEQAQKQGQEQSIRDSGNGTAEQTNELRNVGSPVITINQEAAKRVAPAPALPVVIPSAPQIIPTDGMPANAKSAGFIAAVEYQCPTVLDEYDVEEVRKATVSGTATALFVPHNNFKKFAKAGVRPRVAVASVPETLAADVGKCLCLGILQVEANADDAAKTNLARVRLDAAKFARTLEGYPAIYLVTFPKDTVSVNKGVNADAKGLGAGTGATNIWSLLTGMLGLSANISNGRTFVEAQVGETFALVAGGAVPEGAVALDPAKLRDSLEPPKPKAEAQKQK